MVTQAAETNANPINIAFLYLIHKKIKMKKSTIKLAMYLNYFVFAILLNSVGIVILKAQIFRLI
tara:strand:- start:1278 stop:1469 length:192 start_codon:yes stop_codon:yes gene_type:complete